MTAAGFAIVLAAGDRDEGALRQVRHGLAVLAGALEVAGVDRWWAVGVAPGCRRSSRCEFRPIAVPR